MELDQSVYMTLTAYAFFLGIFLGAVYDVFRILRMAKRPLHGGDGKGDFLFSLICDLAFSMIVCFCCVVLFYYKNDGEIRWFAMLAAGAGFALYLLTVGKITAKIAGWIIWAVKTLLKAVIRLIFAPIFFVGRLIFSFLYDRINTVYQKVCSKRRKARILRRLNQL